MIRLYDAMREKSHIDGKCELRDDAALIFYPLKKKKEKDLSKQR